MCFLFMSFFKIIFALSIFILIFFLLWYKNANITEAEIENS
jgi:hypothetical protein